jgi:glycosyltransferase involved in cell wall biosynthesis
MLARTEHWLRKSPDAVICNSMAGYELCRTLDFPGDRLSIARNILDLEANRFDREGRIAVRRELGIPQSTLLIGGAGRIDPVKGFEVLIKAVAMYGSDSRPVALAIAGDGPPEYRQSLVEIAEATGMVGRLKWVGRIDDMKRFYSAVDIFCSSSIGAEATSNVVAEALACERLTIATEVGDSPELIGDSSLLAIPGDAVSLAETIARAAARLSTWDGAKARARIGSRLSAEASVAETEQALMRALTVRRAGRSDARELES